MSTRSVEVVPLTERVHLVRGDAVNWVLVADERGVLMIDAGYPGDRGDVLAALGALGHGPADVTAVLLTHGHVDHLGSAVWLAEAYRTPVYCHPDEVAHARRDYLEQASPLRIGSQLWRPSWATWTVHLLRKGGLSRAGVPTAQPLTAEIAATLPGQPTAIPTPGHTGGHCSYLVDGVLASGDALVTGHAVLPHDGPQLLPALFSHNQDDCLASLSTLARVPAQILAPGHGAAWFGPIAEAADAALTAAHRR